MIATEKNKHILAHYLDLVNRNYKDLPPEKEIIVGSFLVSENSQESEVNNSVQILVVKRTSSRKKQGGFEFTQTLNKWGGGGVGIIG